MKALIACIATIALLSGCANLTPPARSSQLEDGKHIGLTMTRRDAARYLFLLIASLRPARNRLLMLP